MVSKAQKEASKKYDKANTKGIYLKFNLTTDKDLLDHLQGVKNVQGYIKELIRSNIISPQ